MTVLTEQQRKQFLEKGYVTIHDCFSREAAEKLTEQAWIRLGYDPDDQSTWEKPRIHMPGLTSFPASEFAPMAWAAACELCGGEDRVKAWNWGDPFILSLNEGADQPWSPPCESRGGWHKDGDFFRHFLDSPEQGLLSLVLWSDIDHQGSATYAAPESPALIARFLAQHPEGVMPGGFNFKEIIGQCHEFVECTGKCGDVVLLHPYMLHSGSQNMLRKPRFLTNPPLFLNEPMNFNRANPADYSLIEQVVLRALGVDRLDFAPTSPRERVVPERERRQREMAVEEKRRLAAAGVA